MTTSVDPGRVLRRAIIGWGLGHAMIGRRELGAALLAAELIGLALVGASVATLADTTWYLVPFVLGSAFLVAWTAQAVLAYRAAQRRAGAIPPTPRGSAAAATVWLAVPLLMWGTGFWLVAATAATPAAVLDRFVTSWAERAGSSSAGAARDESLSEDPTALWAAASAALARLQALCAGGALTADCADAPDNPLRDIRFRVRDSGAGSAVAVAELVRFERRPTRFLGIFDASELVPVALEQILRLDLAARPAALGARRWTIVNASVR